MAFVAFDPDGETRKHRLRLPHWRQRGVTYFVTARLADSIPGGIANDWRQRRDQWLANHGMASTESLKHAPEELRRAYHREFTVKFHELIDAGHGECWLGRADCASVLVDRFEAGDGTAYRLDAWCIMPNHFHALVCPIANTSLGEILRHWKGGSAWEINRMLGRKGPVWQKEPFDHIVRSEAQLEHFRRYISENPVKAGLKSGFVVGNGRRK